MKSIKGLAESVNMSLQGEEAKGVDSRTEDLNRKLYDASKV